MCLKWASSDSIRFSLLWQSIIYFLLTLGLELWPSHKLNPVRIKEWWSKKGLQPGTSSYLEPLLKPSSEAVALDLDEDIDVKTERNRVLSGSIDNAIIYLRNLQKVSLALHKITCFLSLTL